MMIAVSLAVTLLALLSNYQVAEAECRCQNVMLKLGQADLQMLNEIELNNLRLGAVVLLKRMSIDLNPIGNLTLPSVTFNASSSEIQRQTISRNCMSVMAIFEDLQLIGQWQVVQEVQNLTRLLHGNFDDQTKNIRFETIVCWHEGKLLTTNEMKRQEHTVYTTGASLNEPQISLAIQKAVDNALVQSFSFLGHMQFELQSDQNRLSHSENGFSVIYNQTDEFMEHEATFDVFFKADVRHNGIQCESSGSVIGYGDESAFEEDKTTMSRLYLPTSIISCFLEFLYHQDNLSATFTKEAIEKALCDEAHTTNGDNEQTLVSRLLPDLATKYHNQDVVIGVEALKVPRLVSSADRLLVLIPALIKISLNPNEQSSKSEFEERTAIIGMNIQAQLHLVVRNGKIHLNFSGYAFATSLHSSKLGELGIDRDQPLVSIADFLMHQLLEPILSMEIPLPLANQSINYPNVDPVIDQSRIRVDFELIREFLVSGLPSENASN